MAELVPFYMKINSNLKSKLKTQATKERTSMVHLVSELLEQGLMLRPRLKQDSIDRLINASKLMDNKE
jgi:hypothetical protein